MKKPLSLLLAFSVLFPGLPSPSLWAQGAAQGNLAKDGNYQRGDWRRVILPSPALRRALHVDASAKVYCEYRLCGNGIPAPIYFCAWSSDYSECKARRLVAYDNMEALVIGKGGSTRGTIKLKFSNRVSLQALVLSHEFKVTGLTQQPPPAPPAPKPRVDALKRARLEEFKDDLPLIYTTDKNKLIHYTTKKDNKGWYVKNPISNETELRGFIDGLDDDSEAEDFGDGVKKMIIEAWKQKLQDQKPPTAFKTQADFESWMKASGLSLSALCLIASNPNPEKALVFLAVGDPYAARSFDPAAYLKSKCPQEAQEGLQRNFPPPPPARSALQRAGLDKYAGALPLVFDVPIENAIKGKPVIFHSVKGLEDIINNNKLSDADAAALGKAIIKKILEVTKAKERIGKNLPKNRIMNSTDFDYWRARLKKAGLPVENSAFLCLLAGNPDGLLNETMNLPPPAPRQKAKNSLEALGNAGEAAKAGQDVGFTYTDEAPAAAPQAFSLLAELGKFCPSAPQASAQGGPKKTGTGAPPTPEVGATNAGGVSQDAEYDMKKEILAGVHIGLVGTLMMLATGVSAATGVGPIVIAAAGMVGWGTVGMMGERMALHPMP